MYNRRVQRAVLKNIFVAFLLSGCPGIAIGQDVDVRSGDSPPAFEWKTVAAAPEKRVEAASVRVKGKLYVLGGYTMYHSALNRVDVYDPGRNAWTRRSDMPAHLTHINAVTDGEHIWIAGGFKGDHPGSATDEVWRYDVSGDSWSEVTSLPESRAGGGLALVDGKLHYFGGFKADRDTTVGTHWVMPAGDGGKWTSAPALPDPRGHLGVAVMQGNIYAIGGQHGHDEGFVNLTSCHVYDPDNEQWSSIADLPTRRNHFEPGTFVHNGRVFIAGGLSKTESVEERFAASTVTRYNPESDNWRHIGKMPAQLVAPAAAVFKDKLLITGGGLKGTGQPRTTSYITTLKE